MQVFGILLIIFSSLMFLWVLFQMVRSIIWQSRLQKYQVHHEIKGSGLSFRHLFQQSYGLILSSALILMVVFSGMLAGVPTLDGRKLTNAIQVKSESHLLELIQANERQVYYRNFFNVGGMMPEATSDSQKSSTERDYIKTNVQVEGVDEGDIIKTDGYQIYYASRYQNHIQIITIGDHYEAILEESLDLGQMYTDAIYLTEEYLIVIGYIYEMFPMIRSEHDYYHFGFFSQTGAILVYDRESLDVVYRLDTTNSFYEHRLYGNEEKGYALYLVGNQSIYGDEKRPIYTTYDGNEKRTYALSYDQIFYTPGTPIDGMTVITGIRLGEFTEDTKAYLGGMSLIYASEDAIYTTQNIYEYTLVSQKTTTQIWKFGIDIMDASVTYIGQGKVDGSIQNSYWMDAYEGHLRVVTSEFSPINNYLFILKDSDDTDQMEVVGSITKGLGKPDETVKSVRFSGNLGRVVTFRQMDPLYTIDLSNPANPVIIGEIEEPGFSTYLHIWNQPHHAIGFGFTATDEGVVTGMKISAYDTSIDLVLDTYELTQDGFSEIGYSFSYSEASYNPKALMISPSHMIFGFPVVRYGYDYQTQTMTYQSMYFIFTIDFDQDDPNDILKKPAIISAEVVENYLPIERGIYIDGYIYTFSSVGVQVYHLETHTTIASVSFKK